MTLKTALRSHTCTEASHSSFHNSQSLSSFKSTSCHVSDESNGGVFFGTGLVSGHMRWVSRNNVQKSMPFSK